MFGAKNFFVQSLLIPFQITQELGSNDAMGFGTPVFFIEIADPVVGQIKDKHGVWVAADFGVRPRADSYLAFGRFGKLAVFNHDRWSELVFKVFGGWLYPIGRAVLVIKPIGVLLFFERHRQGDVEGVDA